MKIDNLVQTQKTDRATVYQLADGDAFAVVHPPNWGDGAVQQEVHEAAAEVRTSLNALAAVDMAKRHAAADPTLSEVGRARKVDPLRASAREVIGKATEQLEHIAALAAKFEQRTYAPPALDQGDFVSALQDQEIRNFIRGRSGAAKTSLMTDLAKDQRMTEAVLRSPIDLGAVSEVARRTWHAHVTETHPDVPKLQHLHETVEWARATVANAAARL